MFNGRCRGLGVVPCRGLGVGERVRETPRPIQQRLEQMAAMLVRLTDDDIGTIIRRESHWQSRVLRNDRH
jgi:hypothetical protein